MEEVGPFVYKAVTVKDSVNLSSGHSNLRYNEDGETLTYRPRLGHKRYTLLILFNVKNIFISYF